MNTGTADQPTGLAAWQTKIAAAQARLAENPRHVLGPTPEEEAAEDERLRQQELAVARKRETRAFSQHLERALATTWAKYGLADLATYGFDRRHQLWADKAVEWLASRSQHLLLWGTVGSGKTFLSVALLREAARQGLSVALTDVRSYTAAFAPGGDSAHADRCLKADLLVIDDVYAGNPSDKALDRLYDLIEMRQRANRRTVVTSNIAGILDEAPYQDVETEASQKYARMWSRLSEGAVAINASAPDDLRRTAPALRVVK